MNLKTQEFWIRTNNLIKENKITQEALCKDCDIVLSTYKGWIMRGIYPNAKQIVDMSKVLKTTPEYLIYGKTESIPQDIINIELKLLEFSEEERAPIIAMLNGQIEYWKKILNKGI